jgi:catechol O-methyltransferase
MMNLGPEKASIVKHVLGNSENLKILELGGYCGYSSLVFSSLPNAQIHTIEISEKYANIARQIQTFAGVR